MRLEVCLCAAIPCLETQTKIIVVISRREYKVPTNTGRLAGLALANSVILQRGHVDRPMDLRAHLGAEGSNFLVFPGEHAQCLSTIATNRPGPLHLIFPDSNWRGAAKMCHKDPIMAQLPMVTLPPGPPSTYRVRRETKSGGLATMEAIARALGMIEGPQLQKSLENLFDLMVSRTMASRGYLNDR